MVLLLFLSISTYCLCQNTLLIMVGNCGRQRVYHHHVVVAFNILMVSSPQWTRQYRCSWSLLMIDQPITSIQGSQQFDMLCAKWPTFDGACKHQQWFWVQVQSIFYITAFQHPITEWTTKKKRTNQLQSIEVSAWNILEYPVHTHTTTAMDSMRILRLDDDKNMRVCYCINTIR